jgi:hypothetical protein
MQTFLEGVFFSQSDVRGLPRSVLAAIDTPHNDAHLPPQAERYLALFDRAPVQAADPLHDAAERLWCARLAPRGVLGFSCELTARPAAVES